MWYTKPSTATFMITFLNGNNTCARRKESTAEGMELKSARSFARIPKDKKKTETLDNGNEFSRYESLEKETGMEIYFAYPYHSWERGSNENFNGLLRQYFPKGTPF